MIVDHAENGQIGVEMFSVSEPNYYDAILMDIRMPVMDEFEAKKTDIQTVPIIVITANGFNEDVEKSINAGMNAHLGQNRLNLASCFIL